MIEMKKFRKRALFSAGFVTFGVLALAAGLNELATNDNKKDIGPAVAFQVKKTEPPKKTKKVVRKKRSKPKPRTNKAPPPPMLSGAGSLSGVAVAGLDFLDDGSLNNELFGDTKNTVMTEDTVDRLPQPRRQIPPSYPDTARDSGITGEVTYSLLIGTDGRVERIKVAAAQPSGVFEQEGQNALSQWEFEPATFQGNPVRVWATQTLRFELN